MDRAVCRRTGRVAAALGALALAMGCATGCATVDRSAQFRDFAEGRYADARAGYEAEIRKGGPEVTLDHNSAGTVALVQGDLEAAHRHFREAFTDLEDLSATTGETVGAIVGPERSRRWKGDPYERCMNAYYLGVTYWLLGDLDNAAASFKAGLLRDADSEAGAARSDFALLWFLLGRAQRDAGHAGGGAEALATARALLPGNPHLHPDRQAEANLLVVVELGLGPAKVPAGPHGSVVTFRPRPYAADRAEVLAGGRSLGVTAAAVDVHHQAVTRGGKVLDHVNQGKAVFKDAAVVGGALVLANSGSQSSDIAGAALILAGLLAPAEADVRQWDTLPGEVHVLLAELPPGRHTVRIEPLDGAGRRLPELAREVPVEVRPGRTSFAWARAAPRPGRASSGGEP